MDTLVSGNPRLNRVILEIPEDCGNTFLWSTSETASQISVDQTGEYSVIITDQNGCLAYDTVNVEPFAVNLNLESATICNGDSVLLDAGPGYDFYSWSTGDTTQSIYASIQGEYDITAGYGSVVPNNFSLEFDGVDDYVSLPGFNVAAENINGRSTLIAQFNGYGPIFAGSVTTAPVNPIIFRIAVIDAGNGEAFIKTYHRSTHLV